MLTKLHAVLGALLLVASAVVGLQAQSGPDHTTALDYKNISSPEDKKSGLSDVESEVIIANYCSKSVYTDWQNGNLNNIFAAGHAACDVTPVTVRFDVFRMNQAGNPPTLVRSGENIRCTSPTCNGSSGIYTIPSNAPTATYCGRITVVPFYAGEEQMFATSCVTR